MNNQAKVNKAIELLEDVKSNLQEKLDLIQAEETHGSVDLAMEDNYADGFQAIEDALELLNTIDV